MKPWQNKLGFLISAIIVLGANAGLLWLVLTASYAKALFPEVAIKAVFIPIILLSGWFFFAGAIRLYNLGKSQGEDE